MDKVREGFEELPEIKNSLSENIVFIGNKYTTANDGFYDLVNWLNGAWYTWQSRQAKVDEKDKRIQEALNLFKKDRSGHFESLYDLLDELEKALRGEHE